MAKEKNIYLRKSEVSFERISTCNVIEKLWSLHRLTCCGTSLMSDICVTLVTKSSYECLRDVIEISFC